MNQTVVIKVSSEKLDEMRNYYLDCLLDIKGDYIAFVSKNSQATITGYLSSKANKKVMFVGPGALAEALLWDKDAAIVETNKEEVIEHWIDFNDQIGSDEVGVGDLCLPLIVVAAFVKYSQMKRLFELGIHDSKKMTDTKIREIGPILVKEFEFSKLTLHNDLYNKMIAEGENINSLKAKMHNQALYNLTNKYPDVIGVYVDEFVNKKKYYEYLRLEKHVVKDISFKTKGESSFPCVALASVIARYAFLLEKDKLEKEYNLSFPFGAGKAADDFVIELLKNHSLEEVNNLVKINFKNYQKIINN